MKDYSMKKVAPLKAPALKKAAAPAKGKSPIAATVSSATKGRAKLSSAKGYK